ncbi:MAG: murein hydrolase activator EnvC family protein [Faecousia sp.]
MKNRKRLVSVLSGIMAAVMLLTLLMSVLPTRANAASSSEIRKQINQLKKEKQELQDKIADVQEQYEENENEIADIIAKKNVIDQEIQILSEQITNMNDQLSAYNLLIADKQDELDNAEDLYAQLNEENKVRVRTMEEEGQLSYWEVLFKANSFSDLLDRLNMVEEISAADNRRLQQLSDAADAVEVAQEDLQSEKAEMEVTKKELDDAQEEMNVKRQEADDLLQELLSKADDLEALEAEFQAMDEEFLKEIASKEQEYNAAKQAEWLAYMATYVPPTTAGAGTPADQNNGGGGSSSSGWVRPCSYTSITSPFGYRQSPTTGASTYHQGVDLDTGTGWPVVAAKAGVVTIAGYGSAAGNYVKIDHGDGISSIYMHLSSYCVRAGQIVSAGQQIGATGATGVATGDHLHFGISVNGVYVNPCNYVAL